MGILFVIVIFSFWLLIGSRETQRATEHLQRDLQRYINRRNAKRFARR